MSEIPTREQMILWLQELGAKAHTPPIVDGMNKESATYVLAKDTYVMVGPRNEELSLFRDRLLRYLGVGPAQYFDYRSPLPSGPWGPDIMARRAVARVSQGMAAEIVLREIETAWRDNKAEVVAVMALWGIHPTEAFEVRRGIYLTPLSEVPPSTTLDSLLGIPTYGPPSFTGGLSIQARPTAALTYTSVIDNLLVPLEDSRSFRRPWSPYEDMREIARCLTLHSPRAVRPIAEWEQTPIKHPIVGGNAGLAGSEVIWGDQFPIDPEPIDADSVRRTVNDFFGMGKSDKQKLRTVLGRLNTAKSRSVGEDKAIDLGVALEALLGASEGGGEISLKFRMRGTVLATDSVAEREQIFNRLDRLYSHRSHAAHGGVFNDAYYRKMKHSPMDDIQHGIALATSMVLRVLRMGRVPTEWNGLILGYKSFPSASGG